MLKVALTGNIGSGKSTVIKIFRSLDVPVFIADIEARLLYYSEDVKQILGEEFGTGIFDGGGEINTQALAEIIFNDKKALETVNKLIHPLVFQQYLQWLEKYSGTPYTLHESAILFENNLDQHFDKIINVSSPEALRLQRVVERDEVDAGKVIARMANQLSDEEKNRRSDFVINNDGEHFLIPQVLKIDKALKSLIPL